MRPTNRLGLAVLVVLVVASCGGAGRVSTGAPPFGFTDWIEVEMEEWVIPGASVVLAVIEDYEVVWAEGFGLANTETGERITTDTRFQAASVSKPIAAIAAVMAYDEFGLSLDDDVNEVLASMPDGRGSDGWELPNPHDVPVTMRMLLSHLGGTNNFNYTGFRNGVDEIPTTRQELDGTPPANTW